MNNLTPHQAQMLSALLSTMQSLRLECPWDKKQTPQSLTKYAIEEAYEVEAAILSGNLNHIKEELGDLLLQVIFQAQMFSEQQAFDFFDIAKTLNQKLIRRHPHVFGEQQAQTDQDVATIWQAVKAQEKQPQTSILNAVKPAATLPQAQQLQELASTVGFDWPNIQGALDKLKEEIAELEHEIRQNHNQNIHSEMGDVLFSMVNVARKLNVNANSALDSTNKKFITRFTHVEQQLAEQQKDIYSTPLHELEVLWQQAKKLE